MSAIRQAYFVPRVAAVAVQREMGHDNTQAPFTTPESTQSSDSSLGTGIDGLDAEMRPLDAPEAVNRNESIEHSHTKHSFQGCVMAHNGGRFQARLASVASKAPQLFVHRIFEGNAFRVVLLDPSVSRFPGGEDLKMKSN